MPVIQLELDSTGAIKSLQKFDKAADVSGKKTESSLSKMRKSVTGFTTLAITSLTAVSAAVLAVGVSSLQAASDMEETQGKFDVVFRGMTDQAEQWSQELVNSYGLSRQASKQYLSSIQDLLVPTGLARDKAGELSNSFVQMARDFASFNNLPTEQVIRDIQSALQGSSETMAKYGVNVKAAKVQQEVLNLGLATSKDAITDAHKAQAIYSIALREGADAMGDFARTSGSFANQQEILKSTLEDIRAEIGQNLLPIATMLITKFNEWLKNTDAINTAILWTVKVIRFVHDGIAGLILIGDAVVAGFAHFFDFMAKGFRNLLTPLDLIFDKLVELGAVETNPFDGLTSAADTFKQSSTDVFNSQLDYIQRSGAAFDSLEMKIAGQSKAHIEVKNTVQQQVIPVEQQLEAQINRVTTAAIKSTTALRGQAAAANAVSAATGGGSADFGSGVSVSFGGATGGGPGETFEESGVEVSYGGVSPTIVNNFNTQQSKSDIEDITNRQLTNEART